MTYTIIGLPKARPFRVVWMMEELGLEYDIIPAAPGNSEAFKFNPTGKVPALKVDDDIVIDSVAIMQFLADKHNQLTFAAGTVKRAQQDSFTQFISDELDGALWTAARNGFVLPEDKRVPAIVDTLKWEFDRSIKALDARLGDNLYLMGDTVTVPDLFLTHCIGWAKGAGFPYETDRILAHNKRMRERDGFKRADAIRKA